MSRSTTRTARIRGFHGAILMGAALVACQGDERLSLDIGTDEERERTLERFRSRLAIEVAPGPEGWAGTEEGDDGGPGCTVASCSAVGLAGLLEAGCVAEISAARDTTSCGNSIRAADAHLCVAERLLQIIDQPESAEANEIYRAGLVPGHRLRIGRQDAESNFELARVALQYAGDALTIAGAALQRTDGPSCERDVLHNSAGTGSFSSTTLGRELAHYFISALHTARDAGERIAYAGAAVSDAQFSRTIDREQAAYLRLADSASRTAAAHALAGGAHGLPAFPWAEHGLFSRPPLSREGRRALEVLRWTAIDPGLVVRTGDVPTLDLIEGGPDVDETGPARASVRYRLSRMMADVTLASASAEEVCERAGVTVSAMQEAREWLAAEIRAFDRPHGVSSARPAIHVAPERLGDGTDSDFPLFAATRLEPAQPPAAFWSAVTRFDPTPAVGNINVPGWQLLPEHPNALPPGATWGDEATLSGTNILVEVTSASGRTLGSILEDSKLRARELMGLLAPQSGDSAYVSDNIIAVRDMIAGSFAVGLGGGSVVRSDESSGADDELLGSARICGKLNAGNPQLYLTIDLRTANVLVPGTLRLVVGHEGLECAIRGTIDGVPCQLDDANPQSVGVESDGIFAVTPSWRAGSGTTEDTASYYFVRLRSPASPVAPGAFEPLIGFVVPTPTSSSWECIGAPITPVLDDQVQQAIAPYIGDPALAETSCAGLREDDLLPLENELTDDHDGVESSWRHYVGVARTAAEDADALAEELATTILAMEERAEQYTDELAELCGVRLSVTAFMRDLPDRVIDSSSCPSGYDPVPESGTCVLDPIAWAESVGAVSSSDADRLRACVGASENIPWVTIGDQEVCLWWTDESDPSSLCGGNDPTVNRDRYPCPVAIPGATEARCMAAAPAGADVRVVPLSAALRLVTTPERDTGDSGSSAAGGAQPCEALARLRNGVGNEASVVLADGRVVSFVLSDEMRVQRAALLGREMFGDIASRLGWRASAGDFSRVTVDGSMHASTGRVGATETRWPIGTEFAGIDVVTRFCTAEGGTIYSDPAGNGGSLFCLTGVSGDDSGSGREARARANDLLARAVIAARVISGTSLADENVVVPYWPRGNGWYVDGIDNEFTLDAASDYWAAPVGTFWLDQAGDGPGHDDTSLTSMGAYVEWLDPAVGSGDEWTHCAYDGTCVSQSWDSGATVDLPLILRQLAPEVNGTTLVNRAVAPFFNVPGGDSGILSDLVHELATDTLELAGGRRTFASGTRSVNLADASDYFAHDLRVGYDSGHGCIGGCVCQDRILACIGGHGDIDVRGTAQGNFAHIEASTGGLTARDVLNALELACVVSRIDSPDPNYGCGAPPPIHSLADLIAAQHTLECWADEIGARNGASVLQNVPESVVNALRGGALALGTGDGVQGEQMDDLTGAFEQLADAQSGTAAALRELSIAVDALESVVAVSDVSHQLQDLSFQSNLFNQIASCAQAALAGDWSNPQSYGGVAITCANAAIQTDLASRMRALQHAQIDADLNRAFSDFDRSVGAQADAIRGSGRAVRTQLLAIAAALSALDRTRHEARLALARALYLESDGADAHLSANAIYRARYNTLLTRYQAARARAVRATYIARRSVEQRLAMRLDQVVREVGTVPAPSTWVDELCTLEDLDADSLRGVPGDAGVPDFGTEEGYASAFLGDYLDRLEAVVEAYSFVYPFHEGTDTVVMSLRDDVFGVRAPCDVQSPNLLYHSDHLDMIDAEDGIGWYRFGCDYSAIPEESDGSPRGARCITARAAADLDPSGASPDDGIATYGSPTGFRLTFGGSAAATLDTALVQIVTLPAGRYRLSWYGRPSPGVTDAIDPKGAVQIRPTVRAATEPTLQLGARIDEGPTSIDSFGDSWERFQTLVSLTEEREVAVVIHPALSGGGAARAVDLAGPMLEAVPSLLPGGGALNPPGPYFGTSATRTRRLAVCPDLTGETFRARMWDYQCTRVCPDGYDGDCHDSVASSRCYYQATLPIDSRAIERALTGTSSGFAGGNYNYRIESLGVNVVGTAVRDCESGFPGCYGAGNVSFSLMHTGPFMVRNALGEIYESRLFPGRIEGARSLASERYLTNPLSSADESLMSRYWRTDFVGRPIAGTFALRIWDEPGLDFSRVEDVQLVLHYRYWQHQR